MLSVEEPLAIFTVLATGIALLHVAEGDALRGRLAGKVHLRFVGRAVREADDGAAAFAVARVEPHREALRPVGVAELPELHFATGLRIGAGVRPIETGRFVRRHGANTVRIDCVRRPVRDGEADEEERMLLRANVREGL